MRRIVPLTVLGALAALVAPPAHAVDYRVDMYYPSADQTGLRAAVGAGFAACGAGASGNLCRTAGALTAHAAPGLDIPAWNGADFVFTPPAGTTILGGSVTMRHRTTDAGVHARLLYHAAGAPWTSTALADSAVSADTRVEIPPGVAQFGPSLYARTAVPAGRILSPSSNTLEVLRIGVWLRDAGLPTIALAGGTPFADGAWHRGGVCARVTATDGGLGVYAVYLDIDGQRVGVGAPAGPPLQPRPRAFAADLCIDTRALHDGYLAAVFRASDGPFAGGNSAAPVLGAIRVDNTAPALAGSLAADTTDRQPEVVVRSSDALSGLAEISASVGGVAVLLAPTPDGAWRGRPVTPLGYGVHAATFHAADAAGNVATGAATVTIADRVPPVVDGFTGAADGFAFAARDAESGLEAGTLGVALDGRDVDAAGHFADGVFRYAAPAPLGAGAHGVVAHVTDVAGNTTTRQWTFAIPAAPVVPGAPAAPAPLVLRFAVSSITVKRGTTHVAVRALRGATAERGLRITFTWPGNVGAGSSVTDERGIADIVLDGRREGTLVATAAGIRAQLVVRMARGVTLSARRVVRAVRLSGTVLPARAAIVIEAYASGHWRAVRTLRVRAGKFATGIVLRRKGLYVFRATTGDARSPAVQVWLR
jgi:hypothetical protein